MFAGWPDVDVPAFGIFQAQPRNGAKQRVRVPHTREHRSVRGIRIKEADFESVCAHSAALLLDGFRCADRCHLLFRLDKLSAQA
jgi:hypothetical protein